MPDSDFQSFLSMATCTFLIWQVVNTGPKDSSSVFNVYISKH